MQLRIPGLIARLSGLEGKPFRNSVLIDVSDKEELLTIEKLLYVTWRRESRSTLRHEIKRSLDAAAWQIRKALTSLEQEQ